jgi:arsenite-transporting ATPase
MMQLQDPERTKVLLVTLPETTPVLEAANLQSDLERAGIHPWGWIINNSLSIAHTQSPLLCQRARQELPQIEVVKNQHASRIALVPVMAAEPTGIENSESWPFNFCIYRAAKPPCLEDLCYWQALFLS